jgi:hypothetical protein
VGLFTDVVGAGKAQLDLPELLAGRVVIGSPEECAEDLVRLARATGFTRLIARVQWMGMDQRIVRRTIELLAERVLPLVQRELGDRARFDQILGRLGGLPPREGDEVEPM